MIYVCLGACRGTKGDWMISKGKVVASLVVDSLKSHKRFYFILFYFNYYFISTTSIDIHCSSTYSKIKSQKSHTRYLISSQGILHFTKQLKNVEMFRVCN